MKKQIAIISLLLLSGAAIQAQGIYGGLNPGFAFPALKQSAFEDRTMNIDASGAGTDLHETHAFSFGYGFCPGFYAGYMINKNIGVEAGLSYIIGNPIRMHAEKTDRSTNSYDTFDERLQGGMLRVTPALRLQYGEGKIKPFMTMGLVLGLAGKATEEQWNSSTGSSGTTTSYTSTEILGGIGLGAKMTAGAEYQFGPKFALYLAANGTYQSWSPKKAKLMSDVVDGVDQMPGMTTSQIEMEYVNDYTQGPVTNPNEPRKQTKIKLPFSSIGFEIGIHLNFGKTEE